MSFIIRRALPGMLALFCLIASLIIPVPLPGIAGQAYAATGPDLTIQSIVWSPPTPMLGDQVRFTVNVSNQGDDLAGNSRLLFYIDDHIADSAIISQIAAGSTLDYIFTWKAAAGSHVVKVVADSDEAVAESNENNNEKSYAFSVLAPDLIVSTITWTPAKPSMGSSVIFTVTVQNQGNKAANTQWIDFLLDGVSRGQKEGQPLEPGASYTRTYTWIAQPGQHTLKATVDVLSQSTESDETNNDLTIAYCTTPPDLIISALTWKPVNRTESGNVTMSIQVKNQGEGAANGSWLEYYVDGNLQTSIYVNPLPAGANTTKTYEWQPGPYERLFTAKVDNSNWIFESDESNNNRNVTLPALGLPDLSIQSVTWSPAAPNVNSRMTFTITVKNSGVRTVDKCDLALYLTGLVRITRQPGPIAPGATIKVDMPWITGIIPVNGRVAIDDGNAITESNEANNEKTFTLTPKPLVPTADLTIENITCTPANPGNGETVTIKAVIKNQGSGPADASSAICFVDNEMLGYMYFKKLAAGASQETEIKWKAVTGEHQVKIIVDVGNSIAETNENNNEVTTPLNTSDPDLAIEKIEWFPTYPEIGKDVSFTVTVKNQGTRASGQCFITYYIEGSKQGEHYLDPIQPGAAITRSFTWNIQGASLTFKAVIDQANTIVESDKTNNEKSVYIPAPNLAIQSVTFSEDYPVADAVLGFTVDMINTGMSQAGVSKAAAYIDGNALAQIDAEAIDPGKTFESVFFWTASPGKHTLRVVVDEGNAVTESNESDNVKEVIIFVPLPAKTLSETSENSTNTDNTSSVAPAIVEKPAVIAPTNVPTPTPRKLGDGIQTTPTKTTTPDISGNISATPDAASGGVRNILLNKVLIFGVAGAGITCIGVLVLLRKRAAQPKKEKAPKAPKAAKPAKTQKPAQPDKKNEKPVKKAPTPLPPTGTLSGKPPVAIPPLSKAAITPGSGPLLKPVPPPLPPPPFKPAAPPANPNLGTTLLKQQSQPPPPAPANPPPKA